MTVTFDPRSGNIDNDIPRKANNIIPKNEVNPTTGLGGVHEHTHTHAKLDRVPISIIIDTKL